MTNKELIIDYSQFTGDPIHDGILILEQVKSQYGIDTSEMNRLEFGYRHGNVYKQPKILTKNGSLMLNEPSSDDDACCLASAFTVIATQTGITSHTHYQDKGGKNRKANRAKTIDLKHKKNKHFKFVS